LRLFLAGNAEVRRQIERVLYRVGIARSSRRRTAMTHISRLTYALLAVALVPTAVAAQKVTYDFERSTNFAQVRSFSIQTSQLSENPFVNERITHGISSELTALGLSRTDNPDIHVVPSISTELRKKVTAYTLGYGFGGWYTGWYGPYGYGPYANDWGSTSYEVRDVRYDTLTIDMIDAKTGQLVWRGQGVEKVKPYWKPDKVDRKVKKVVAEVLENFPPGRDD
jgi:hypothetical protein